MNQSQLCFCALHMGLGLQEVHKFSGVKPFLKLMIRKYKIPIISIYQHHIHPRPYLHNRKPSLFLQLAGNIIAAKTYILADGCLTSFTIATVPEISAVNSHNPVSCGDMHVLGRSGCSIKLTIFKHISGIYVFRSCYKFGLRWMSKYLTYD